MQLTSPPCAQTATASRCGNFGPWLDSARLRCVITTAVVNLLAGLQTASAADACKVLLCLAAPSWRSIPECVPPVRQVLHDVARGRPFPVCSMAGNGNSAAHEWAAPPIFCPPQYSHTQHTEGGPIHTCDYVGAVTVTVNGSLFTRTWWTPEGDSVTEFSAIAKAQLKKWDTRFDDEYAAWVLTLPSPTPPVVSGN